MGRAATARVQRRMNPTEAFAKGLQALRQGAPDQAETVFRDILAVAPDHAASGHFLGVVLFQAGKHEEALNWMRRSVVLRPNEASFHQNLGGALRDLGRYEEALPALQRAVELAPDDVTGAANLATVLHRLGRREEASRAGQHALALKDRQAMARAGRAPSGQSAIAVPPFRADAPSRNIIAFSLWGEGGEYLAGAVENAELVAKIYPGWTARFYLDSTVPLPVVRVLEKLGAQIAKRAKPPRASRGSFWRFEAANDASIDRFLCRDSDSRLNPREAAAVNEWIAEGSAFHIMRDSPAHIELILAGMWGGVAGVLPDLGPMVEAQMRDYGGRWADQVFLRQEIWPRIRSVALAHDSVFEIARTRRFPPGAELPDGSHVGGAVLGGSRGSL
ncbi:MAG: tetratricopeptide repeat protein [Alphaproteobacteria bacterium]|nr:tetratricopeptide repeat protein [Alphaproteobacteria bacterium]